MVDCARGTQSASHVIVGHDPGDCWYFRICSLVVEEKAPVFSAVSVGKTFGIHALARRK